jgi:hypothetical protein
MSKSRVFIGIILLTITLAVLVMAQGSRKRSEKRLVSQKAFAQTKVQRQQNAEREQVPIVDYAAKDPIDPQTIVKRRVQSRRYNTSGSRPIEDSAAYPYLERIGMDYWWKDTPALPVEESDIVLVAVVREAQAHLSEDRTAIYSEFNIAVEEVLKSDGSSRVFAGSLVSIERSGGAVRFPSGHLQKQIITGQGMPRVGTRYLLFLKDIKHEEGLSLVTGYELAGEKIIALDGANVGGGKLPFDQFNGSDLLSFLAIVRGAILQSPPNQKEKQ